jgi:ADP-ribosyl-[dinitrogen reductase] hydrolase
MKGETIRQQFPKGVRELSDGGAFNTLAGQPTDDSEMALMLARSLISEGKYDAGAVLEAYLHWYRSGPFDIGITTTTALQGAELGKDRKDRLNLAASNQSQANGSLMRISPVAIFGWSRPDEAVEYARLDSGLTHPNQICREACAVFVRAITSALSGANAQACYRAALEEANRGHETSVISSLEAAAIAPLAIMDGYQSGWVLIALQNAFYQLLHADSFEDALVETISRGGDTDTNAAICGALLGAIYGRDRIPAKWRQQILTCRPLLAAGAHHPRLIDFWPVDVYELAERLLVLGG